METKESKCQALPFFKRISKFSINFSRELAAVKKELEMPPGTYPKNYYAGIQSLKSEVDALKDLQRTADEKMEKVLQFRYFLDSTKELLQGMEGDISEMESYLEKFGYVVPKFEVEDEEKLELSKEDSVTEERSFSQLDLLSPELGMATTTIAERVETQVLQNPVHSVKSSPSGLDCEAKCMLTTPVQKSRPFAWYTTPTPNMSAKEKVSRWFEANELKATQEMTPAFQRQKLEKNREPCDLPRSKLTKLPVFRKETTEECVIPSDTARLKKESTHTPEEPQLSAETKQLLFKKEPSNTPEEPLLSSIGKSVLESNAAFQNNKENVTPEEPVLSRQSQKAAGLKKTEKCVIPSDTALLKKESTHTPEEPQLSAETKQLLFKKEPSNTPEEPLLSSIGKSVLESNAAFQNNKENVTPEEPVLSRLSQKATGLNSSSSTYHTTMFSTPIRAVPESPQLSDLTQRILNFKTVKLSEQSEDAESTTSPKQEYLDTDAPSHGFVPDTPELSEFTKRILIKRN